MRTKETRENHEPRILEENKKPKNPRWSYKEESKFWKATAIVFAVLFLIALFF